MRFYHRVQPVLDGPAPAPAGPCRLRGGDPCPLPAQHLGAGRAGNRLHHLCDEGGRVVVWQCDADGTPVQRVLRTGIYVNLLPEGDALRVKQGLRLPSETELRQLLEDLGG